ncbi:hypothetical protein BGZ96_008816, partial [Linnemannia gamsii]
MASPYNTDETYTSHLVRSSPRAADSFVFQTSRSISHLSDHVAQRMPVLPSGNLSTPTSSSRFLNVTRKLRRKASSSSTTDVSLLELDHDNESEKGYSSDSGFFSKFFRKARLGESKWKRTPKVLPSESPADVPVLIITVDTPESTGNTVVRKSETVQLPQPENGIPPQPPVYYPTGSHVTDRPSPLGTSALRYDIFLANAPKPTVRSSTPLHPRAQMESTLQLVFCARLLLEDSLLSTCQSSLAGVCVLDDAGRHWFDAIQEDPPAQTRIRWLVSRLVAEFLRDPYIGPEAIFEVVVLGPVLCQADYRALLSCFIERFDNFALLNVNLLQGIIQLLQSAPSGFLTDDDLIRILGSIRKRLESTHAPDRVHVYQLVFAVSKVLEVMVRGEVKGLNRQRDHQSLLAALRNLKGVDDDEFLKFQVNYAYQMSLYLPDDETSFQAFWRYAESAAVGVSAVASVFKLDPMSALAAVEHIQQVAGNAIDVVKFNVDGARAFQSTAEGATQAAEKAYWSQKKQPWFLALQAGYLFVQDGRLVDFNILVCNATRIFDVNFQRGVCQILGEVALNPLWDDESRRSAIDFLGELCKTDAGRKKDIKVRKWVTTILQQISSSASPDVSGHACTLLDDLQREHTLDNQECRALYTLLPIPTTFPLLERALDITDIDHELACIRFQSLEECLHPVSIPLRAKATLLAPKSVTPKGESPKDESFPLMAKVQEFLRSDNLVFLVLGDSGSGKSIFCRQLERELWSQYQHSDGGRIPLYINLPSIDDPHCGLIEKYMQHHHDILEPTIQKIKRHRQFVLICDGYDESRLTRNLHTSNRFNRPGQWNVKMIITCRSTFISCDYQDGFRPLDDNKYHDNTSRLFEEAAIVPFLKSDIQEFVKQYVLDFAAQESSNNLPAISYDDYWEKLSVIPNLMNLVSNPFLLTLALKAIPSRSIKTLDSTGLEAMQHDIYDGFIQEWVRLHQKRLQGTILRQDIRAALDILLRDGFAWCVFDYLKRLADAIYQYQDGNPVVKFSRWHMDEWKVKFFGPEIETTLLREASPLTRAGTRHWFIHKSLLDYFYSRTFFDPDDSDDDDSDYGEDGDDDSWGGGNDFHSGGGNSLSDGGNSLADDNGEGSTGGNAESTGSSGNGGSSGGNGGTTSGDQQDSSGGGGNSSGGSSGGSYGGNNEGSRGDKNDSNGDEDGSRRRKDDVRSKRYGNATKSRPSTSSDPFSKRNLFKEPLVLQFLVDRAKSDPRLKKRLFSIIERSKASSNPSLAAANAITILYKSGNRFQDAVLDGVPIPNDYVSTATERTEQVQLSLSNLTGKDLMKLLATPAVLVSGSAVPATLLAVSVTAPTVSALMPFSITISQKTPTAPLKPSSQTDSPNPDQAITVAPEVAGVQGQIHIEQARQSGKSLSSEALSSPIASKLTLASIVKTGFKRTVSHKLDLLNYHGVMTQQIAREVLELQKQMNDRLILIQSKTEVILTQQLELTEYPIPRLFIALPEELAKYDPGNWFRTKFRLHFICECGKHTEANNSKVPHHLHLAKHEGYLIREPTKFFKKYGPFLLLMLQLIKFGTSIAGHVVPTLASLKVVELADSIKQSVELVTAKIDYSLECIDNQLARVQASSPEDFIDTESRAEMTQHNLTNYLSDVEGLEGIELRQLGSFLKTSEDENLLGNLYRMTTSEGHVKWVCRDHYRASYQEKYTQKLHDVVELAEGEFDEHLGRIKIVLRSRIAAAEFYDTVRKAKGVLELIIDWGWECTRSDLEELEESLKQSSVSILQLDLRRFRTSLSSKLLSTSTQFDPILRIRGLSSMKVLHISISKECVKFLGLSPKKSTHVCKMFCELAPGSIGGKEVRELAEALRTNSTLTSLDLGNNSIGEFGAKDLSRALETNSTLITLNLRSNSIGEFGAKALSRALETNSTLTSLDLRNNSIGEFGAKDLSRALETNSTLITLNLRSNSIGEFGAKALSRALETNSTLTSLDLGNNSIGEFGAEDL